MVQPNFLYIDPRFLVLLACAKPCHRQASTFADDWENEDARDLREDDGEDTGGGVGGALGAVVMHQNIFEGAIIGAMTGAAFAAAMYGIAQVIKSTRGDTAQKDAPPPRASDVEAPEAGGPPDAGTTTSEPLQQFEHGTGLSQYEDPSHQYGTKTTLEALKRAGIEAAKEGLTIEVGDISLEGGKAWPIDPETGKPTHAGHRRGFEVDIRPGRIPDTQGQIGDYRSSHTYSRANTQKIVNILRRTGNVEVIYFNDPNITGVTSLANHYNHLHVRYKP